MKNEHPRIEDKRNKDPNMGHNNTIRVLRNRNRRQKSNRLFLFILLLLGLFGGIISFFLSYSFLESYGRIRINNSVQVYFALSNPSNKIKKIINRTFKYSDADIVAVAFYLKDSKTEKDFIQFMYQKSKHNVIPIPNARYYLDQNNLYERYEAHQDGSCFIRSFEQSGTTSFSCPLYSDSYSFGYITIEYLNSRKDIPSRRKLEKFTRIYSRESSPLFYPIWSALRSR